MRAPRSLARAAILVPAALLLLGAGGCSLLGRSGGGPNADPAAMAAAADSAAATEGTAAPPAATPDPAVAAVPDSASAPDVAPPPAPTPVQAEANDQVRFELSDQERDALLAQATKTLADIRRRLDKVDRNSLTPDREEKLRTIESLVHNAEDSMGDDVRAAATLSRKARLLLDDLVSE